MPTAAELSAHLQTVPIARALLAELSAHRARRVVEVASSRLSGVTLVLENISDPHNASAVLRTCEGLGVETMHVVEQPNKWEKNKAIARSADDWMTVKKHHGLARCLGDLSAQGFALYAADVGTGCISIADVDVRHGGSRGVRHGSSPVLADLAAAARAARHERIPRRRAPTTTAA